MNIDALEAAITFYKELAEWERQVSETPEQIDAEDEAGGSTTEKDPDQTDAAESGAVSNPEVRPEEEKEDNREQLVSPRLRIPYQRTYLAICIDTLGQPLPLRKGSVQKADRVAQALRDKLEASEEAALKAEAKELVVGSAASAAAEALQAARSSMLSTECATQIEAESAELVTLMSHHQQAKAILSDMLPHLELVTGPKVPDPVRVTVAGCCLAVLGKFPDPFWSSSTDPKLPFEWTICRELMEPEGSTTSFGDRLIGHVADGRRVLEDNRCRLSNILSILNIAELPDEVSIQERNPMTWVLYNWLRSTFNLHAFHIERRRQEALEVLTKDNVSPEDATRRLVEMDPEFDLPERSTFPVGAETTD